MVASNVQHVRKPTMGALGAPGLAYIVCLMGPRRIDLNEILVMVRSLAALDDENRTSLLVLHESAPRPVSERPEPMYAR